MNNIREWSAKLSQVSLTSSSGGAQVIFLVFPLHSLPSITSPLLEWLIFVCFPSTEAKVLVGLVAVVVVVVVVASEGREQCATLPPSPPTLPRPSLNRGRRVYSYVKAAGNAFSSSPTVRRIAHGSSFVAFRCKVV